MKKINNIIRTTAFAFLLLVSSCKNDDVTPTPANGDLGSFAGNIQVSDDPFTNLGYVYNAKVSVVTSGSVATMKVTGDLGFNREYTGTFTSQVKGIYSVALTKQTKPSDKIAGGNVIIIDNKLTIDISLTNDNVTAKENPTAVPNIQITGKIRMIGTDMLKQ